MLPSTLARRGAANGVVDALPNGLCLDSKRVVDYSRQVWCSKFVAVYEEIAQAILE
jgi:hypothetical protein